VTFSKHIICYGLRSGFPYYNMTTRSYGMRHLGRLTGLWIWAVANITST